MQKSLIRPVYEIVMFLHALQWGFTGYPEGEQIFRGIMESARDSVSQYIGGIRPERVIFTTGVFDGLQYIIQALGGPGSIASIVSDREISGTCRLLGGLSKRVKNKVRDCSEPENTFLDSRISGITEVVEIHPSDTFKEIEDRFANALLRTIKKDNPKHVLVYISWITFDEGLHIPVSRIARRLKKVWHEQVTTKKTRSTRRLIVVADMSHVIGNIRPLDIVSFEQTGHFPENSLPIALNNINEIKEIQKELAGLYSIDVLLGDFHKWFQGPNLSGFIVINDIDLLIKTSMIIPNLFALHPYLIIGERITSKSGLNIPAFGGIGVLTRVLEIGRPSEVPQEMASLIKRYFEPCQGKIPEKGCVRTNHITHPDTGNSMLTNIYSIYFPDISVLHAFKDTMEDHRIALAYHKKEKQRLFRARIMVSSFFNRKNDVDKLKEAFQAWDNKIKRGFNK